MLGRATQRVPLSLHFKGSEYGVEMDNLLCYLSVTLPGLHNGPSRWHEALGGLKTKWPRWHNSG